MYVYRIPKWANFTNSHSFSHRLHSLTVLCPHAHKHQDISAHVVCPGAPVGDREERQHQQSSPYHVSGNLFFWWQQTWLWTTLLFPVQVSSCYRKVLCFRVSLIVDSMLWFRCILIVTFLPCSGNSRISILFHHTEITFECFLHNARAPLNLVYRPLEKSKSPGKRNVIWTF